MYKGWSTLLSGWGRRLGLGQRLLVGGLVGLLTVAGLPAPEERAEVLPHLAAANGNLTEVGQGEHIEYQAQISVPAGGSLKAGAVLTVTFPEEVQLQAYDTAATAAMAQAPRLDIAMRTFTVTWNELKSGALQSFPFVATPSALANAESTFEISARLVGETGTGTSIDLTARSAPIAAQGDWNAELVQPGGWTIPAKHAWSGQLGQVGNTSAATMTKVSDLGEGSFSDLRFRVNLTDPSATIPQAKWLGVPRLRDNDLYTVVQHDDEAIVVSNGAIDAKAIQRMEYIWGFRANVEGQEPGTYTAPLEIYDVRPDGTEVPVARTTLELTLTPQAAAEVSYLSKSSRQEVRAGEVLSHRFAAEYSVGEPLRELALTLPVPDGTAVESFNSARAEGKIVAAKLEYSADGERWESLEPHAGGVWTFAGVADVAAVKWVRVTQRDDLKKSFLMGQHSLNLRVDPAMAAGTTLTSWIEQVTYWDPPVNDTLTVAPQEDTAVSTLVVDEHQGLPSIAARTVLQNGLSNGFDAPYYNGAKIRQDLRLASYGSAPLHDPYQFVIVPEGMSVVSYSSATSPTGNGKSWAGAIVSTLGAAGKLAGNWSYPFYSGAQVPPQADTIGKQQLANGATLYYWKATGVELVGNGDGGEVLLTDLNFKLNSVGAGDHQVIVGAGSAISESFEVNTTHNGFDLKSLADPESFGNYAGQASEALQALREIGITTDAALMQTKKFAVPGKDEIAVSSGIQGSEDSKPITGDTAATSKIGSLVDYQVTVTNKGTFSYEGFQFLDVFPHEGDAFTLSPDTARGSAYDLTIVQRPVLKLNGTPVDALVQVSDSVTPPRFDAQGESVPSPDGSTWRDAAGGVTGAKSLRVTLAAGVVYRPGDQITLDYVAQVPVDAKRGGVRAVNSVAYKLQRSGFSAGLEAAAGAVEVPKVEGDFELGGQMTDTSGAGVNGGVELHLYSLDAAGKPQPYNDMVSQPGPTANGDGYWGFVDLDPNASYLVRPVVVDDGYQLNSELDTDGFLKYHYRGADSNTANRDVDVSGFDGKSRFELSDHAGAVSQWLLDLNFAVTVSTDVTGSLVFVDTDGAAVPGAAAYLDAWTLELRNQRDELVDTVRTTAATGGTFEFLNQELTAGKHTVTVIGPDGSGLGFAPTGQAAEFDPATGVYTQDKLVPGTGIAGLQIRVTDPVAPEITHGPTPNEPWNPSTVAISAMDRETEVVDYVWQLTDPAGVTSTGTSAESSELALPPTPVDGEYTFAVQARDLAGNRSPESATRFHVDRSAPTLTATPEVVYDAGSPAHPSEDAEWIALFNAHADDGLGVGAAPITVDASRVSTTRIGTYPVTFAVVDTLGNGPTTVEAAYVVRYVSDPAITLTAHDVDWEMGETPLTAETVIAAFGASATVAEGSTAGPIQVDLDAVDWATRGDYPVTFTVADAEGHVSEGVTGTINVVDTIAPEIGVALETLTWRSDDAVLESDQDWIDAYTATATDAGSGVASFTVDSGAVNYGQAGTYPVVFTASDVAGNTASLSVSYIVAYAGQPTLSLTPRITHELGDDPISGDAAWKDAFQLESTAGAGAHIVRELVNADNVDFAAEGTYRVIFTVIDSFDSETTGTGEIEVRDTIAPEVTLDQTTRTHPLGQPDPMWRGSDYAEFFGAQATDGKGTGIDPDSWSVSGTVAWTTPGTYEISLAVADRALHPNRSEAVTGHLTIQAPPAVEDVTRKIVSGSTHALDPAQFVTSAGVLEGFADGDLALSGDGEAGFKDGKLVYTAAADFVGIETVQLTVTDDLGQQAKWTVTFDVRAPLALIDPKHSHLWYETTVDGGITIPAADILALVTGEQPEVQAIETPRDFRGTITLQPDGAIAFDTDQSAWFGRQAFPVTVVDEFGTELEITVELGVFAVEMTLDHTEGLAGETVFTTELAKLVPNQPYTLEFRSHPVTVAKFSADAEGRARVSFLLPAGAAPGEHELAVVNEDGADRAVAAVTVLEDGAVVIDPPVPPLQPQPLGELPVSGGTVPLLLALVGALAAVAGGLLMVRRARSARTEP